MPEEKKLCSVVIPYSFFELRKSTNCVKRDQMNDFFAKEWNFTVAQRKLYSLRIQQSSACPRQNKF